MIVFRVLNFDSVTEILKIRCHIYILKKIVIILRKIHLKMKSFTPPQKETKHIDASAADYCIQYQNRRSRLVQMQEAATVGVLRKKVFFKISQNSQDIPVPEETPVNFGKFLRSPFLQNNSGRLLLKAGITVTKREIQIIFVVESSMQCLLLRLKSQSAREESNHPAFMDICPTISYTYQSYLPDR